jgi:hypothetical protein
MSIVRDLLAICGSGIVIVGCWSIYQPLGLVVLGAALVAGSCWWAASSVDEGGAGSQEGP